MKVISSAVFDASEKKGGVIHYKEMMENLVDLNVDLTLILPQYQNIELYENVFDSKVDVKYINVSFLPKTLGYILFEVILFFILIKYFIFSKVDVFYQRTTLLNFFSGLLSKIFRVKYITELNGLILEEAKHQGIPSFQIKIINLFHKYNLKIADRIITVTDGIGRIIAERYKLDIEKIEVISNGANDTLFFPREKSQKLLKQFNFTNNDIVIGYLGILTSWHALEYLMDAFLITENTNLKLLIVGDGPLYNKMKIWIEKNNLHNRVIMTGKVEYNQVSEYVSIFDYCYMGISKEPLDGGVSPLKFFEYMASGKPMITSNVPDINYIVEKNELGIIFNNEKDLVEIFNNLELNNSFSANKINQVFRKSYSWKELTKKLLVILND